MCKKRSELIEELLRDATLEMKIWLDRPYTAANVTVVYEGVRHTAIGFSKVCRPDKWGVEFGCKLAIRKAIAKIVKRILSEQRLTDEQEKAHAEQ